MLGAEYDIDGVYQTWYDALAAAAEHKTERNRITVVDSAGMIIATIGRHQ